MEKIEVTWGRTLSIWWSYVWRCTIFTMVGGVILGAIGGLIVGVIGRGDLAGVTGGVLGYVGSIPVSIFFLKKILEKQYKTFSIALLPRQKAK